MMTDSLFKTKDAFTDIATKSQAGNLRRRFDWIFERFLSDRQVPCMLRSVQTSATNSAERLRTFSNKLSADFCLYLRS